MLKIAELAQRSKDLSEKIVNALYLAGFQHKASNNDTDKIRVVFAGQYSAGKSSILKMLTLDKNIKIGEGITTQKIHTYEWSGIEIIDTPGIHTQLRPDHDQQSYEAIASADMIVFVITNELFDSHMAEHFRKLAIDKDKAGEMILVINKMDRANLGNTQEQQDIIREDLRKVLSPYTPEQLKLSFLDAESYLDSIDETDLESIDDLVSRSGYAQFIDTLNSFVEDKSISSKLTTGLYELDGELETAIKELQPKSADIDIDALEENFLQQRHLLIEARSRIQQEVKDIYDLAASKVRDIGLDAANLIVAGCKQAEVEDELCKSVNKAENIVEECQNEAFNVINTRLKEIGQQLDGIENSEFSQNLKAKLCGKFDNLPDGIKKIITNAGPGLQKVGKLVSQNAYKAGVQGGLKLTNFSGSSIHQMVLKVGHKLNIKFKPWQAIKITKGIAIGGQVLGFLGVGASVFMQIKADNDEKQVREDIKNNRQNVRSQFNEAANELEDYSRKYIQDSIYLPLNNSIETIDSSIQEIRDTRSDRSSNCRMLEDLQNECRLLIKDIHTTTLSDD